MRYTITLCLLAVLSVLSQRGLGQEHKQATTIPIVKDSEDEDATPEDAPEAKKKAVRHVAYMPLALGFESGLNPSFLVFDGTISGVKQGVYLGGVLTEHLAKRWYFQSGLYYVTSGGSDIAYINSATGSVVSTGYTWNVHSFKIPASILFKCGQPEGTRFFFSLGAFAAVNIGGSSTQDGSGGSALRIGSGASNDLKAIDAGVTSCIGLELKSGLFFRLRSETGYVNLRPLSGYSTIHTGSYGLGVGYLFNRKARLKRIPATDDEYLQLRR